MEILTFKTNIAGSEAIQKAASYLDGLEGVKRWKIHPETEENILSISAHDLDPQLVENALKDAGFKAEILRVVGISGEDI
jgi:copper chaperone